MKPGRVSSADRAPPPGVAANSTTTTDHPDCARRIAAASPFGPDPTTIASVLCRSSLGTLSCALKIKRSQVYPLLHGHQYTWLMLSQSCHFERRPKNPAERETEGVVEKSRRCVLRHADTRRSPHARDHFAGALR